MRANTNDEKCSSLESLDVENVTQIVWQILNDKEVGSGSEITRKRAPYSTMQYLTDDGINSAASFVAPQTTALRSNNDMLSL